MHFLEEKQPGRMLSDNMSNEILPGVSYPAGQSVFGILS